MSIRLTTRVSWSVLANLLSIYPLSLGTVCTPPAMSCNVKTDNQQLQPPPPPPPSSAAAGALVPN